MKKRLFEIASLTLLSCFSVFSCSGNRVETKLTESNAEHYVVRKGVDEHGKVKFYYIPNLLGPLASPISADQADVSIQGLEKPNSSEKLYHVAFRLGQELPGQRNSLAGYDVKTLVPLAVDIKGADLVLKDKTLELAIEKENKLKNLGVGIVSLNINIHKNRGQPQITGFLLSSDQNLSRQLLTTSTGLDDVFSINLKLEGKLPDYTLAGEIIIDQVMLYKQLKKEIGTRTILKSKFDNLLKTLLVPCQDTRKCAVTTYLPKPEIFDQLDTAEKNKWQTTLLSAIQLHSQSLLQDYLSSNLENGSLKLRSPNLTVEGSPFRTTIYQVVTGKKIETISKISLRCLEGNLEEELYFTQTDQCL